MHRLTIPGSEFTLSVFFLLALACCAGQAQAPPPLSGCIGPPSGLMSWWPLDESEGSETVEDVIGDNFGTVNGALLGVEGQVGRAASFDPHFQFDV